MKINFRPAGIILLFALTFSSCKQDSIESKSGINVDISKKYQTIEGFGSCMINYKSFPEEYTRPEFYDLVVNDLGLSILRVPMMEHLEWVNDDDDPDHFNWDGFWTSDNLGRKGLESSMWLANEFKKRGVERFMSSPWSPPDFLKTHRSPIQGGYLRPDMLDEFAENMAAQIILAKKNYGIDLNWVSIQNELLFVEFYRSCIYNPWTLKETLRAVMRKFENEGINSKILLPEDMMFSDRMLYLIKPLMDDPETSNFNGHFCTHRRGGKDDLLNWVSETDSYKRQNWMTETSGHDQNWEGAFKMACDIQDYLVYGNFSAWIYWQLSETAGAGVYSILVDGKPGPKYYASKQFYRYIRPGAVRVAAGSEKEELLVSAFHHPVDGSLTIVVINTADSTISSEINQPYSFEAYRSSESENCVNIGEINVAKGLSFPPESITTLLAKNRKLKTEKNIPGLPESWVIPSELSSEPWGNSNKFPRERSYQLFPDGGNVSALSIIDSLESNGLLEKPMHNGWTWLHSTIMNGDGDVVKMLIDAGADINARANDGWTPLHMASSSFVGNLHKENRLKDYTNYDIFRLVMDAGPDLDAITNDGQTALHAAVMNAYRGWRGNADHSLNRIRDLIAAGVNTEKKDINGRTALHFACMEGFYYFTQYPEVHADVVRLLLDKGAVINATDNAGMSALHYACQFGYQDIVLELVKRGADTSIKDKEGRMALDIATAARQEDIIYILQNGEMKNPVKEAESGTVDQSGDKSGPELLKAAWRGDVVKVKELLESGADIHYRDTDGFSALERARDNGHKEIVRMIERAGKKE